MKRWLIKLDKLNLLYMSFQNLKSCALIQYYKKRQRLGVSYALL